MRVHVVSDVHGRADALATAADGADALFCLGDLLVFIDYLDHQRGIFPDLFGADAARQYIALRTSQRFDEARAMSARLRAGLDGDPARHFEAAVSRQYAELFAAMPTPMRPRWRPSARLTCCARTSRPRFPSCSSTRWRSGWSGAAKPCSMPSGGRSRVTCSSGTCTSR